MKLFFRNYVAFLWMTATALKKYMILFVTARKRKTIYYNKKKVFIKKLFLSKIENIANCFSD
jgi:hypothetical protein